MRCGNIEDRPQGPGKKMSLANGAMVGPSDMQRPMGCMREEEALPDFLRLSPSKMMVIH